MLAQGLVAVARSSPRLRLMDREAALARIQAIVARRTVIQIELIEAQAEERQLRKFCHRRRTSAVVEASSYQILSIHMKCITVSWAEVISYHAPIALFSYRTGPGRVHPCAHGAPAGAGRGARAGL